MPRPCNSAEYISGEHPSAANHDGPAHYGERDRENSAYRSRKAILIFGYSDGLLHPPAQIRAQAASRGSRGPDRQEGGTERSAMVVLSGPRFDLIWRPFHPYRCNGIPGREQVAIHLVLILNSFAFVHCTAAFFLRRLLLSLGRNELNRHGGRPLLSASWRARCRTGPPWRAFSKVETILSGVPA